MTPALLTIREHHRFEAAGRTFVCIVPGAAIFALNEAAGAVVRLLSARARTRGALVRELADGDVEGTIDELIRMQVVGEVQPAKPTAAPLSTALDLTNQSNPACASCYEHGSSNAAQVVGAENASAPAVRLSATAQPSADPARKEPGNAAMAHLTFFGADTLMNHAVLTETICYPPLPLGSCLRCGRTAAD